MKFLALDLEMNQPSRKIIQIGACVCSFEFGVTLDEVRIFIKPNELLNPQITQLTGITEDRIARGMPLIEGFEKIQKLHQKYKCSPKILVWGGNDSEDLKTQLSDHTSLSDWPFSPHSIDVKTIYIGHALRHNLPLEGGLATAMSRLGLKFDGRKHDALDDARNTFIFAHHLLYATSKK